MKDVRTGGHTLTVAMLLIVAVVFVILAVEVPGGLWLLILAALCGLGVFALLASVQSEAEPVSAADTTDQLDRADQPLLFLVVLLLLAVAAYFLVRLVVVGSDGSNNGAHPSVAPPVAPSVVPSTVSRAPTYTAPPSPVQSPPPSPIVASALYQTASAGVHLRAAATTTAPIVTTIPAFATAVALSCFEAGEPVFNEPYWYRTTYAGVQGYVSGLWLDTGSDPARTGLPRC